MGRPSGSRGRMSSSGGEGLHDGGGHFALDRGHSNGWVMKRGLGELRLLAGAGGGR